MFTTIVLCPFYLYFLSFRKYVGSLHFTPCSPFFGTDWHPGLNYRTFGRQPHSSQVPWLTSKSKWIGDLTSRIQTKIQILLIRFIVLGARSWWCRENARFFSWNQICWDEGSCEAGLCLPGDFCGWCCPGPRSILWEAMFNQFILCYVYAGFVFVFELECFTVPITRQQLWWWRIPKLSTQAGVQSSQ